MKISTLIALPVLVLSLQARASGKIVCVEDTSNPTKKEIQIENIADIRKQVRYGLEYDDVWKVRVTINDLKKGQRTQLTSFEAVATSMDVTYDIDAEQKHGFKLWRYADEANQDGFSWHLEGGVKTTARLHCAP